MNNTDAQCYPICFTTKTETLQCVYRRVKQASTQNTVLGFVGTQCGDMVPLISDQESCGNFSPSPAFILTFHQDQNIKMLALNTSQFAYWPQIVLQAEFEYFIQDYEVFPLTMEGSSANGEGGQVQRTENPCNE